jgi:hypothetical protein
MSKDTKIDDSKRDEQTAGPSTAPMAMKPP